jgi:hypothetical protein
MTPFVHFFLCTIKFDEKLIQNLDSKNQKERGHLKNLDVGVRLQAFPLCIALLCDTLVTSYQITPHFPEECRPRDRPIFKSDACLSGGSSGSGKGPVSCAIKTLDFIEYLTGVSS